MQIASRCLTRKEVLDEDDDEEKMKMESTLRSKNGSLQKYTLVPPDHTHCANDINKHNGTDKHNL